ncbi:acyl-CoA dehydrogenase [Baekduia soli]|uniref:Acyl-CoA dehydrogenase n=1 Tax=Baekduia soli TaxID=496014 RepID=A0A5B8U244_9ACTN|nr:acyl-CoA dehydrogenase family protein [Baekduia soli]QEC47053.1 acyl-CoA dehydrogenase [Baekduia soli]
MVALAEELAITAAVHGHGTRGHAAALRDARYLSAPIPASRGGLGVTSVHDVVLASTRLARGDPALARGDPALARGVTPHLVAVLGLARSWRRAIRSDQHARARAFEAPMRLVARGGVVLAAALGASGRSAPGPIPVATRTDGGWRVDGRALVCAIGPVASVLSIPVTYTGEDDGACRAHVLVPVAAPGLAVDGVAPAAALRGPGLHTVTLDGVALVPDALGTGAPWRDAIDELDRELIARLLGAAASPRVAAPALLRLAARLDAMAAPDEAGLLALLDEAEAVQERTWPPCQVAAAAGL